MIRSFVWLVLLMATGFSNIANAVGLGEISLKSALNQPLDAEIKLLNVGDLSKNELLPNLGSHEDFARAGVERVFFLTGIKFNIEFKSGGDVVIQLKTDSIVREPFLNFIVELHWPNGRIMREYTLLLDPPVFSEAPAAPIQQARSAPAARPAPVAAAPATPVRSVAATPTRRPPTPVPSAQGGDKVVIKKNDTLWGIARDNKPGSEVSIRQTMMAIQRHNPHAFINNNINLIKAGQVIRIPSAAEVQDVSSGEALAETRRQNQEWREKRTVQPISRDDEEIAAAPQTSTDIDGDGQLQLIGDDLVEDSSELASSASGAAAEGQSESGTEGAGYGTATDVDESVLAETTALAGAKVDELEAQVEDLKRLLSLKDEQLALLQASSAANANAAAQAPASAAPEPASKPASPASSAKDSGPLAFLTENPIYIGIAILVLLALLVFFGALARRKSDGEDYPVDLRNALEQSESEVELPDEFGDEIDDQATLPAAADDDLAAAADVAEDVESEDEAVRKIIEEAEIYTAYGRYERAMEIMEPATTEFPDNTQLRLKIAEVCIASDNASGLLSQEAELQRIGDTFAIQKLQSLKRDAQQAADAMVEPEESEQAAADMVLEDPENVIEFESSSPTTPEESEPKQDEDTVEFSLSDSDEQAPLAESADEADLETTAVEAGSEASEEDFLGDSDESATKLELARAYIDMADKDAAEDILNEVIEEGSDAQKQEARQLLESLG